MCISFLCIRQLFSAEYDQEFGFAKNMDFSIVKQAIDTNPFAKAIRIGVRLRPSVTEEEACNTVLDNLYTGIA